VWGFALALILLGAGLFSAFHWLPAYTLPYWLGVTRPALILVPLLWVVVGSHAGGCAPKTAFCRRWR
jgi:hypothetical protein